MGFAGNIHNPYCYHTGTYCVFGLLDVVVVLIILQIANRTQKLQKLASYECKTALMTEITKRQDNEAPFAQVKLFHFSWIERCPREPLPV